MSTARMHPSVAAVKLALESGKLGAAALVRLHRWRPRTPAPDLYEQLAADLDLTLWLVGQLPTSVFARTTRGAMTNDSLGQAFQPDARRNDASISVSPWRMLPASAPTLAASPTPVIHAPALASAARGEMTNDYVQVHLGFPEDGMALVDLALTLPPGAGYFSLSVIGTSGAAYADDHANTHLAFQGGPATALLAESLRAAAESMGVSEQARRKLAPVLDAVRESLAADRPIELAGGVYDV